MRYEAVNAMLLNEFLKEHRKRIEQDATINELRSQVEGLSARLEKQAAEIQKVADQVAVSRTGPRLVANQ